MDVFFVLIFLFSLLSSNAYSEKVNSISLFTYPVEAIYIINNPRTGEMVIGSDYHGACNLLGEQYFWGVVPSKNEKPACYSSTSYNMVIGADTWYCSDGTNAYFNVPHNYCLNFIVCPDASWTLSENKEYCIRQDLPCIPDPENISEEQALAALAYGESHWSNDYKEMAGIASAARRRMKAMGFKSINELILKDKNFAYATDPKIRNERYYNIICGIDSPGVELAYKASRNALNDGTDYSNGACFWDGVDLKVNGENAYRYKARFKLANKNHNVLSVIEPPPLQRRGKNNKYFEYTYISTSGINKTIFWKYTKEALEAGETQCI
ncbi:hypothetical protein LpnH3D14_02599 [Legionella pneumophila]|nr:hypothetical protein LpnH3D14_02599 [Legionella pneumophila]